MGTYNQVAPQNRASIYMAPPGFAPNQSSTSGTLSSNTIPNSKGEMKAITTRSGVAYEGPSIPTPKKSLLTNKDKLFELAKIPLNENCSSMLLKKLPEKLGDPGKFLIPCDFLGMDTTRYSSTYDDLSVRIDIIDVAREEYAQEILGFSNNFLDGNPTLTFERVIFDSSPSLTPFEGSDFILEEIDAYLKDSFADALLLMSKFASTIKSLFTNKDKLFEFAKIPLNENCSVMLLKKHPEKLRDPGKFLIPCDFPGIDVCHTLADLGASINLMPLSIWKNLSLPELKPTQMTLELANRSITRPKGVAEDVFVKVGKFHFSTDFVVVDFEADPRVPLILGSSFLRTGHALIDVYGEEITLRVNDEAVTFNLNQTTRYSSTYDDLSVNRYH
nr:reverse transcriptase domain-containing protein [Tanacetum cinerariifolium]